MEPTTHNLNVTFVLAEVRPVVKALVRKLVKDRSKRPDGEQEAFMKIVRMLPRYDPAKASLTTWSHMVGRSAVFDFLRREARAGDVLPVAEGEEEEQEGREADPAQRAADAETKYRLHTPKRQQVAKYINKYPAATKRQVARACGVDRKLVTRVRGILRQHNFQFGGAWANQYGRLAA